MSAHVSLNLLNELGKKIKCEALPCILSIFPNSFNKLNTTARKLYSIYHDYDTKIACISVFRIQTSSFRY